MADKKNESKKLIKEYKYAWEKYSKKDMEKVFSFCEDYKGFLTKCKTERECVSEFVVLAKKQGYRDLNDFINSGETVKPGDKLYSVCRGKALITVHVGNEPIEKGMRILGAHIDSPRLDLKQNPLYQDSDLAMMDTHYYGGIKKYQWVATPLAFHGVVVKKDGSKVNIVIGEDENDPVIGVSDLLIHLSKDQYEKKLGKAIEGENLNLCVGSIPIDDDDDKDKIKKNVLKILNEKYNIEEEDFVSAEIEVVPAGKARDFGLDKSMIMAYGHDDRVCAYTSFKALMYADKADKTLVGLFVDKEEIGSVGATGMTSKFFENTIAEIMSLAGQYNDIALRRALANSKMLSSDVNAAYDPNFPSVMEKNNAAYLGKGVVFSKYTGRGGKYDSNDADPEYIASIRNIMDKYNVNWQTGELGKVDQGGGGTIAYILAEYGMDVIDCGVSLHNMHAPYEVASKADIYETVKCYCAFLSKA